jgi:hypothetical protein
MFNRSQFIVYTLCVLLFLIVQWNKNAALSLCPDEVLAFDHRAKDWEWNFPFFGQLRARSVRTESSTGTDPVRIGVVFYIVKDHQEEFRLEIRLNERALRWKMFVLASPISLFFSQVFPSSRHPAVLSSPAAACTYLLLKTPCVVPGGRAPAPGSMPVGQAGGSSLHPSGRAHRAPAVNHARRAPASEPATPGQPSLSPWRSSPRRHAPS